MRRLVLETLARESLRSVPLIQDTRPHPRYQQAIENLIRAIAG